MSSEDNRREWKRYSLGPREELRIEVEDGQTVLVCVRSHFSLSRHPVFSNCKHLGKLLDGTAELFGTELAKDREYSLELAKIAIFTYHGCQLVLDKEPSLAYISADTPMVEYLNVHENLEVLRNRASEEGISGPRVVICGAEECGKNALSSILLNYAVRVGRKPVFVDLDVALNELSCHGSIAASPIYSPKDIEKGFIDVTPTVHFFGYTSIAENVDVCFLCHVPFAFTSMTDVIILFCVALSNFCSKSCCFSK